MGGIFSLIRKPYPAQSFSGFYESAG